MLVKKWTASKNNMDIIKANASSQAVSSRAFPKLCVTAYNPLTGE